LLLSSFLFGLRPSGGVIDAREDSIWGINMRYQTARRIISTIIVADQQQAVRSQQSPYPHDVRPFLASVLKFRGLAVHHSVVVLA
jgi:hypothetical protein